MSNKVPPLWKIYLLLIGIPASWLIVWFLLALVAHLVGFSPPSVGDPNVLLSTIGSIMGAIFTVGGLIVALVAVLTQIQLQDRVKQEVDKAKQEVEDTFNNKLRLEYEKRIQDQVEGMLAFFQATSTTDWRQAEALVREALQKYPRLPGMRLSWSFLEQECSGIFLWSISSKCSPKTRWFRFSYISTSSSECRSSAYN